MRRILFGWSLVLALAAGSCQRATIAGHWEPLSIELGGKSLPVSSFGGATLRLTADSYDFAGDKGSYTVLSTRTPARMDIHGQEGPSAGQTIKAIYQLAGDELTVCYQLGEGERPAEFKSSAGPKVMLIHYKRVP